MAAAMLPWMPLAACVALSESANRNARDRVGPCGGQQDAQRKPNAGLSPQPTELAYRPQANVAPFVRKSARERGQAPPARGQAER